ncbi:hypothetical protein [Methylobacterium sp. J-077]|uniref:hypothetical protein n=1 Tax=Methylobacterium sp. J-077 TaxID=2836656 RepID=UPI001FB9E79C|nr:hypothetical protein [Methylobacterium sp. J-077]MCJ2125654.1 hypothetical protein [Methylobacterium sp. J-077]
MKSRTRIPAARSVIRAARVASIMPKTALPRRLRNKTSVLYLPRSPTRVRLI